MTNDLAEYFFREARWKGDLYLAKMRSWSGADKPEGELHRLEAKAFRALGEGFALEPVLNDLRTAWKEFCKENNDKVAKAPRMKRGPMSGCSAIHYRYASPSAVDASEYFIRQVYRTRPTGERLPADRFRFGFSPGRLDLAREVRDRLVKEAAQLTV